MKNLKEFIRLDEGSFMHGLHAMQDTMSSLATANTQLGRNIDFIETNANNLQMVNKELKKLEKAASNMSSAYKLIDRALKDLAAIERKRNNK